MGVFGFDNQLKHIGELSNGFYVQQVADNSPAQKAGIKKGDVIKAFAGREIQIASNLKSQLYAAEIGDSISVVVERDGQEQTIELTLSKHPYGFEPRNPLAR